MKNALEPIPAEPMPAQEEGDADRTGKSSDLPASDGAAVISAYGKYTLQCLTIIGQIEGHFLLPPQAKTTKYEHLIPLLACAEQSSLIDGVLILLNTVGGDVEAGLAIAEMVAGMKKPVVSLVLGGGHSIGVPIAVAARRSFIAPSAAMTIHPVRMSGVMPGVPQAFEYFQRMQRRITGFVSRHSSCPEERYFQLAMNTDELVMDIGTILEGEEAVREGLIDETGSLSDALEALCRLIDKQRRRGRSGKKHKSEP